MKRTQIAFVVIGLLALVGGGTALAGKGKGGHGTGNGAALARGMHGPGDKLAAAATYLGTTAPNLLTQLQAGKTLAAITTATGGGKTTAGLVAALVAAEKTELAQAVTAGKLTQAQADQIGTGLTQRFTDFVNGVRPAGGRDGHGFGHHGQRGGDEIDAAASYLGTTAASLLTQLQSGKTLAAIAGATTNKSAAGLVTALVAAEKTELAAAVKAGKLTQAQADQVTSTLTQRFTDLVNGVRPDHGPGQGFFGHAHRA